MILWRRNFFVAVDEDWQAIAKQLGKGLPALALLGSIHNLHKYVQMLVWLNAEHCNYIYNPTSSGSRYGVCLSELLVDGLVS